MPHLPSAMVADWLCSRDVGAASAALIDEPAPDDPEIFNLGAGQVSSPLDWAAARGLACDIGTPDTATVTARVSDGRPPLDISRPTQRTGYRGARPLEDACRDHAAGLAEIANI